MKSILFDGPKSLFKYLNFVFIIFLNFQAQALTKLESFCSENGGQIVSSWTCPSSGKVRHDKFCATVDSKGQMQYTNGCTSSVLGIGDQFFYACVVHDYCYHNEPGLSEKSKADCDNRFYYDMTDICKNSTDGRIRCFATAFAFYELVSKAGNSSWNCSK